MVVKYFLPTMSMLTTVLQLTAIRIDLNLFAFAPSTTEAVRIVKDIRLSTEILPVVSIFTFLSMMILAIVIERAPNSLEVENVEISVLLHFMKEVDSEFFLRVSEGA